MARRDSLMVPPSMSDPPVRTLLLQRTRSHSEWRNGTQGTVSQTAAAVKMERSGEGEDEMGSALGKNCQDRRGGFIDGGEALFIAETSLHVAPDRGGERGWKNGGMKTRSRPL